MTSFHITYGGRTTNQALAAACAEWASDAVQARAALMTTTNRQRRAMAAKIAARNGVTVQQLLSSAGSRVVFPA